MQKNYRFAIIASRFNSTIVDRLIRGAQAAFQQSGIPFADVPIIHVPGAFEIPLAAKRAAQSGRFDALIAIGCVIRGETAHFEYISHWVSTGIGQVALETGIPVAFGVLTAYSDEQVMERSAADKENKGFEAAMSAIEMAGLTI